MRHCHNRKMRADPRKRVYRPRLGVSEKVVIDKSLLHLVIFGLSNKAVYFSYSRYRCNKRRVRFSGKYPSSFMRNLTAQAPINGHISDSA